MNPLCLEEEDMKHDEYVNQNGLTLKCRREVNNNLCN